MLDEETITFLKELAREAHAAQTAEIRAVVAEHANGPSHQFLDHWIAREERSQEMWDRLKGNLIFWLLTGITGMIGLALWNHFVDRQ